MNEAMNQQYELMVSRYHDSNPLYSKKSFSEKEINLEFKELERLIILQDSK